MGRELERLIDIVARLRGPGGCPWDREQTHKTLLPFLLDEAYEFFEAVDESNPAKMKEELGDVLLQVVLHAQLAAEESHYNIEDVARDISDKLIRRHPHVFGDTTVSSTHEVMENWDRIKRTETGKEHRKGALDGIPPSLPALLKAQKVQRRAARVGFDWRNIAPVLDKVEEEFSEFRAAIQRNDTRNAAEELGDILFALVNVARHRDICAEDALRATVRKFERRFRYVEDRMREQGKGLPGATLDEMDAAWEESKKIVG